MESAGAFSDSLVVENTKDDCALGTWRNIGVMVWRRDTVPADVDRAVSMLSRLTTRHSSGIGLVQLIELEATIPQAEARAALARMLKGGADSIRCSVVVSLTTGFRGALVRGIVTGLSMVARHDFPHQAVASVSEAGALLARHLSPGKGWSDSTKDGFERAIEEIRRSGRRETTTN